jgi:dUTP pyrophosphatase
MSTKRKMEVQRLCSHAIIPRRATHGSVGYDLFSIENVTVNPSELVCVSTGVAVKLPVGTYGRIASRSGFSVKYNTHVGAGVIDPDYTGEIKVVLYNVGTSSVNIKQFDRIAQLIVEKCSTPQIIEVTALKETSRGQGGFGSTGC